MVKEGSGPSSVSWDPTKLVQGGEGGSFILEPKP